MRLKPKTSVLHPRALLLKRYTQIERSINVVRVYKTSDNKYWTFDYTIENFVEIEEISASSIIGSGIIQDVLQNTSFSYMIYSYSYIVATGWQKEERPAVLYLNDTKVYTGNIGKYQINKYYKNGTFDYIIKGSVTGNTIQYIKGQVVNVQNLTIKYFNDDINIMPDDLVVLEDRLYSVESIEIDHKHQPKDFKIYTAVLNNIA